MEKQFDSFGIGTFNNSSHAMNETYQDLPSYVFWYVTLINAVIFLIGVTGNIFVIVVVLSNNNMKTHVNILLCNLSVADLLVLLICQPAGMIEFYSKDRWFLGEALYSTESNTILPLLGKLTPFLENASLSSSVLTMWVISYERFQSICRSMRHNSCLGTITAGKAIACIWITACTVCLPFLFLSQCESAQFHDGTDVIVCRTKIETAVEKLYILSMFMVSFVLPLIGMTVIYTFISRTICITQNLDETRPGRHRKQIVIMILAIIALFYVSLFPIRIISIWLIFESVESLQRIGFVSFTNLMCIARILLYINSAGNPIIYGMVSTRFQQAFKRTLRKCIFRREDS